MFILYVEAKKRKKCGLFNWEKPKYKTLLSGYKEFETEEEAKKALDTIDNWFVVDPFDKVKRIWLNTMSLWEGTMRESKTCYVEDVKYSAFII